MNKIEFKRVIRDCPRNESIQGGKTHNPISGKKERLLIDWDVVINGEVRATFCSSSFGRGYDLAIRRPGHYFSINDPKKSKWSPYAQKISAESKAQFLSIIESCLERNLIPTVAETDQRVADIAKVKAQAIAEAAREEEKAARDARLMKNADELISAGRYAIDAMKNMRQGRFQGACSRLQRVIDNIEGKA